MLYLFDSKIYDLCQDRRCEAGESNKSSTSPLHSSPYVGRKRRIKAKAMSGAKSPRSAEQPFLGSRGDVSQGRDKSVALKPFIGSALLAQAGLLVIIASVWGGILSHKLLFFSPHPLLNSASILLFSEAILFLQPTHTVQQKARATRIHAILNGMALMSFLVAFATIYINKGDHPHFRSAHARAGLVFYIEIIHQTLVGLSLYWFPQMFGGAAFARKIYKYHRISGYVLLLLSLTVTMLATRTDYIKRSIGIRLWVIAIGSVLLAAGIGSRIKKNKVKLF